MQVDIEKIIPVTEARDKFNKVVDDVEGSDDVYVFTKNGKPASVMVGVNHLEKLTGESHGDIVAKISDTPEVAPTPAAAEATTPAAPADDPFVTAPAEAPANEPVVAPDNTPAAPAPSVPAEPAPTVPDTAGPKPIETNPETPAPATDAPATDPFATPPETPAGAPEDQTPAK